MDYTELFSHTTVSDSTTPVADAPAHMPVFSDAESAQVQYGSADKR